MINFRSYRRLKLTLAEKRLLVIGPNGVGKSNLLEAVELLGTLRSHRSSSDQDLIYWNEDSAMLRAITSNDDQLALECRKKGGRKAYRNGKYLSRQLDLLGPLRCVSFSALDLNLVRSEPSLRRNWLDRVVQQLEPIYGDLISRFNRLLRQRNQLWRKWKESSQRDNYALLDAFDAQMALVSTRIHRRRKRALNHLQPLAAKWQKRLSKGQELLELQYLPGSILEGDEKELDWRLSIEKQLAKQRDDEERLGVCKVGPHRDEVVFLLNSAPARKFGSAGQQRTLVLALKLAELELVGSIYQDLPILVLDDVFAELDPMRQFLLLEGVGEDHQCLISATHLDAFEGNWKKQSQILELGLHQDQVLEVG
ncbi:MULTISPECIES: DNA replication/repair protein RecF [unclassified Prochlorococcus]|uniref:DNA replication/repair protein RecF n=1 Tax=Prochlorococcus sp. MIT 0602 TaxID=1499499 RepID=UPI001F4CACA6